MAYSDDAVRAKLASLNETQDSIVANAQWIMFHRRHADRTASLWLERLQASPMPKRLNLVYLANEVVQQSKARGRQDFLLAFEPIIAEGTSLAYKGASNEVQGKIKRVAEVWKQRGIFDRRIIEGVEARIMETDRSKAPKSGGKLGGTLFGGGRSGGVPQELDGIAKSQAAVTKAEVAAGPAKDVAEKEYSKTLDPNTPQPTAPVRAARLSALMRNLATAQGAVEASIQARRELLAGLEKLVEGNRTKLAAEEATAADLTARGEGIEATKKDVEDSIMRGISAPGTPTAGASTDFAIGNGANGSSANGGEEPVAPEIEGFTPPPPEMESFTPPPAEESIDDAGLDTGITAAFTGPDATLDQSLPQANPSGAENIEEQPPNLNEPPPSFEPPPALQSDSINAANAFLDGLGSERIRQASTEVPTTADPRLKRRKMSHPKPSTDLDEELFGAGANGAGIDEDGVAALLAGQQ